MQSVPYPRRGNIWLVEEEKELLQEIQKRIPIELIAEFHERTEGGIKARLRSLAADMYFYKNLNIDDISKKTGLTVSDIHRTIERKEVAKQKKLIESIQRNEVISLLKDIKKLLIRQLQSK